MRVPRLVGLMAVDARERPARRACSEPPPDRPDLSIDRRRRTSYGSTADPGRGAARTPSSPCGSTSARASGGGAGVREPRGPHPPRRAAARTGGAARRPPSSRDAQLPSRRTVRGRLHRAAQLSLKPRCSATTPPVRLRQATFDQPASLQPVGEGGLVGPGADGLGEIDVRVRVGGHRAGDRRQRPHQVLGVDGAERRPGRVRELADHDPAAGPGHPVQLAQRRVRVLHVAQPEGDRHGVEGVVLEGQLRRVARGERQPGVLALADPEHAEGEVAGHDVGAGARRRAATRCRCRPPGRGSSARAGRRPPSRPPCATGGPGRGTARRWSGRTVPPRRRTSRRLRAAACPGMRGSRGHCGRRPPSSTRAGTPCGRPRR